jgi:hypothetical protein
MPRPSVICEEILGQFEVASDSHQSSKGLLRKVETSVLMASSWLKRFDHESLLRTSWWRLLQHYEQRMEH